MTLTPAVTHGASAAVFTPFDVGEFDPPEVQFGSDGGSEVSGRPSGSPHSA